MRENQIGQFYEAATQPLVSEVVDVFDARTAKQQEVLEVLQRGVEGILTSEGYQAYLQTLAKFHRYSFANSLLIHAQNPEATHVAGYRKWQELGRQVKKGERSLKIFVPHKRKIHDDDTDEDRFLLTGFGIGSVFDVDQTEGEPLPEPPRIIESTEVTDVSREVNKRLSRYAIDEGLLMESKTFPGNARGFWNPHKNQIVIRRSEDVDPLNITKTKTLAHEMAHYLAGHTGETDRDDAEVVAESSAFVALNRFGLNTENYTFAYVASWVGDAKRLRSNLGEVQRISNVLISAIEGTEPTTDDVDTD